MFEGRKSCRDPEYISGHPINLKVHFLKVWEFGKVQGPFKSFAGIYVEERR